jgi:Asp-tRNA(Asn)/Glu-tRNA(Gln) amidotransferase A subunit family amidase
MPTTNLFRLGLHEVSKRLRDGRLKPSVYISSLLERINELEGSVQAWQWLDRDRALNIAKKADSAAGALRAAHPLYGIPIGVKDNIFTAGIPTEMGACLYQNFIPERSADLVDRIEKSGAFVFGKTVTTEAAFMVPSKTRNPWNLQHTPGGSSSGSAAAVAAGFIPGAVGTQTNGSVIRPAAYCGVVGYKMTRGLLGTDGIMPFSPMLDQPGVFARSVADTALLASSFAGRRSGIAPDASALKNAPRLAAVRTPSWYLAEPEARVQFDADIARLRSAGATIDVIELPGEFDRAHKVHRTIMLYEAARVSKAVRVEFKGYFSDFLINALEEGDKVTETQFKDAVKKKNALQNSFAAFMDRGYSAIITPPTTGEAPNTLQVTGDPSFCSMWTLVGAPAITIPTGLGPRGLPLGLQIVGAVDEDNYLLSTAAWCERHSPFKGFS